MPVIIVGKSDDIISLLHHTNSSIVIAIVAVGVSVVKLLLAIC